MVTKPPVHTHTHTAIDTAYPSASRLVARVFTALGSQSENNAQGVKVSSSKEEEVMSQSQSSGSRFLAGMMKTSTCALHETDREDCRSWAFGVRSRALDLEHGLRSSDARSLAGMTKTSTCALHETDRASVVKISTGGLQLVVRESFCRSPEGRMQLRFLRDARLHGLLGLDWIHSMGFML
jgi:nucleotidyltransferase/DNA polymerase involved in DNA repair